MDDIATPPQMTRPKRRWYKRPLLMALLVALALLLGGCTALVCYLQLTPYDALKVHRSIGATTSISIGSDAGSSALGKEEKYGSVEEAITARFQDSEPSFVSEPLMSVEGKDRVDILYFVEFDNVYEFVVLRVVEEDGGFSIRKGVSYFAPVDADSHSGGMYYHDTEESRIAEHLSWRIAPSSDAYGLPFAYFGVSENPDIGSMEVLGKNPDGVIPYEYDGTTYYFWYYDEPDIRQALIDDPDFSLEGFTLADMIESLQIKGPE